jgi:hypothetical protein
MSTKKVSKPSTISKSKPTKGKTIETKEQKLKVWNKGNPIPNYDSSLVRTDKFGSVMKFKDYGERKTKFTWEIDHAISLKNNGTDYLSNLNPLQWKNNLLLII